MAKYLYGAAVQGIQEFIFQTNKLQEIVGASELVEEICTNFFKDEVGNNFQEDNLILGAAGNIKYVFENRESCQELVRTFPKRVMEMAPGITISQAVVEIKEGQDNHQLLENRLRTQRNRAISISEGIGLMVTETTRKTGGIGVAYHKPKYRDKEEVIDLAQEMKIRASEKANKKLLEKLIGKQEKLIEKFPFEMDDIAKEGEKSWIAVVHADGNNLGQKIISMVQSAGQEKSFHLMKNFSKTLGEITVAAARNAFEKVIPTEARDKEDKDKFRIPFRPVVLGGDDLTAIMRADLALDYTECFLAEFERLSKEHFQKFGAENQLIENPFIDGLTACAGIAYIKKSYPFHYGVTLAESLCAEAKKTSKSINKDHSPSSIMFHRVHASFVEEYEDIIDAELKAKDNIRFNFGPYFINPQSNYSTVQELKQRIKNINRKTAPRSGIRNWLGELKRDTDAAEQLRKRLIDIKDNYQDKDLLNDPFSIRKVKEDGVEKDLRFTPFFDVIALSKIQKTV